jgi:hypothetical protein
VPQLEGVTPGYVGRMATTKTTQTPAQASIRLSFRSVDGAHWTRSYKTLKGARKEAQRYLGTGPDLGSYYAISADGIVRLTVDGCKLADLFPATADVHQDETREYEADDIGPDDGSLAREKFANEDYMDRFQSGQPMDEDDH